MAPPRHGLEEALEVVGAAAVEAGRDPKAIAFEGRLEWASRDLDKVRDHAQRWREAGASYLSVNTMAAGCVTVDDHIAALAGIAEALLDK
jgi:hypothetical protein